MNYNCIKKVISLGFIACLRMQNLPQVSSHFAPAVEVGTPCYVGTVEALCLQDPLFDLIIGNVPGPRRSDDPNPEWGVVTVVATRAQARSGKDPKPLKIKEVTDKTSINKKDLIKMQEEDPTLQKLKQLKGSEARKRYTVSYEKRGGILYHIRQRKDDVGDPLKQISEE